MEELAEAKAYAEFWWSGLRASEAARAGDTSEALARLRRRWPCGAASHPRVLAVIRKYWLLCEALNRRIVAASSSKPEAPEEHDFDPELTDGALDAAPSAGNDDGEAGDDIESEVYPHLFVHELLGGEHDELFEFLTRLTYWPIGLDSREEYT